MIEVKKNNFFLNEEVNTCLNNIIKNKSFANGYIFYGAEGIGKKQTALRFIKEIFTWWNHQTFGTRLTVLFFGKLVV